MTSICVCRVISLICLILLLANVLDHGSCALIESHFRSIIYFVENVAYKKKVSIDRQLQEHRMFLYKDKVSVQEYNAFLIMHCDIY